MGQVAGQGGPGRRRRPVHRSPLAFLVSGAARYLSGATAPLDGAGRFAVPFESRASHSPETVAYAQAWHAPRPLPRQRFNFEDEFPTLGQTESDRTAA